MSRDTQETSSRGVFWEKKGSDRHAQLGGLSSGETLVAG